MPNTVEHVHSTIQGEVFESDQDNAHDSSGPNRHYVVCIQLLAHASDVKKSLIYIAKQPGSQMFKFASSNATRQNLTAWLRLKALYDEGKGGKYGTSTTVKKLSEIWLWLYEK
jgi:hypothetical protein